VSTLGISLLLDGELERSDTVLSEAVALASSTRDAFAISATLTNLAISQALRGFTPNRVWESARPVAWGPLKLRRPTYLSRLNRSSLATAAGVASSIGLSGRDLPCRLTGIAAMAYDGPFIQVVSLRYASGAIYCTPRTIVNSFATRLSGGRRPEGDAACDLAAMNLAVQIMEVDRTDRASSHVPAPLSLGIGLRRAKRATPSDSGVDQLDRCVFEKRSNCVGCRLKPVNFADSAALAIWLSI